MLGEREEISLELIYLLNTQNQFVIVIKPIFNNFILRWNDIVYTIFSDIRLFQSRIQVDRIYVIVGWYRFVWWTVITKFNVYLAVTETRRKCVKTMTKFSI